MHINMINRTSSLLPLLLILSKISFSAVQASADYPCVSDATCPDYEHPATPQEPTEVSANLQCVADPLEPEYGYCGYVGATCSTEADCDFGRCENGQCAGYLGARCSETLSCLGFLTCGTDGLCGGVGATCLNGAPDCFSNTCRTVTTTGPDGSPQSNNICRGAPAQGMWTGSGCSTNDNCASGICTGNICRDTPATPSSRARLRFKRALAGTHEKIAKAMAHAFQKGKTSTLGCPTGLTACLIGTSSGSSLGYECIDTQSSLESCGGCMPLNETDTKDVGQDCTALPNVDSVSCQAGRCVIKSCSSGTSLDPAGEGCM